MKPILFYARHGKLLSIYGLIQLKDLYLLIGLFCLSIHYYTAVEPPKVMYYLYNVAVSIVVLYMFISDNLTKISIEAQWGARLMPYACLTGTELTFFHIVPIDCAPVETVDLETVQHICIKSKLIGNLQYGIDIQYRDGSLQTYQVALDVPFNLEVEDLEAALKEHGVAFTFMRKYITQKTQLPLK